MSTENSRRHRRVCRYAVTFGVSVVALTLAWWWSPILVGVLALAAPFVLVIALAPRPIDNGSYGAASDWRNDVSWWL